MDHFHRENVVRGLVHFDFRGDLHAANDENFFAAGDEGEIISITSGIFDIRKIIAEGLGVTAESGEDITLSAVTDHRAFGQLFGVKAKPHAVILSYKELIPRGKRRHARLKGAKNSWICIIYSW